MKKRSMILSSVAMLLVSVIALTTASFAWFTTSESPTISNIDVRVKSADNLLISLAKNGGWVSEITPEEIFDNANSTKWDAVTRTAIHSRPASIDATSIAIGNTARTGASVESKVNLASIINNSANGFTTSEAKRLKFITGTDVAGPTEIEDVVNADTLGYDSNYVEFEIFMAVSSGLFTGNEADRLKISIDAATIISSVKNAFATNADNTANQEKLQNALRVGFVVQKLQRSTSNGVFSEEGQAEVIIWNPYAGAHFATSGTDKGMLYTGGKYDTADYTATPDYNGLANAANVTLFNATASEADQGVLTIWSVKTYIWVEGEDEDAVNPVAGGHFGATFAYSSAFVLGD